MSSITGGYAYTAAAHELRYMWFNWRRFQWAVIFYNGYTPHGEAVVVEPPWLAEWQADDVARPVLKCATPFKKILVNRAPLPGDAERFFVISAALRRSELLGRWPGREACQKPVHSVCFCLLREVVTGCQLVEPKTATSTAVRSLNTCRRFGV